MEGKGKYLAGNLEKAVEKLDQFEAEGGQRKIPIHRYQWFLLPGIFLLICTLLTNTAWRLLWRPAAALLMLGLLVPKAEARILPATEAEKALAAGDYKKSFSLFSEESSRARGERRARLKLGEGAAAYQAGYYANALESYSEALLSRDPGVQTEASFALGNTIYQQSLGQLDSGDDAPSPEALDRAIANLGEAQGHYQQALTLDKEHKQARANADHVQKVIEMLEQMKQQQQENEQQQDQQEQEQEQENQDPQDGNEGDEGEENENQPKEGENGSENEEESEGENESEDESENGNGNEGEDEREGQDQQPPPPGEEERDPREAEARQKPREGEPTPEEAARRILADNADFQTTPLAQRRLKQPRTDKDW